MKLDALLKSVGADKSAPVGVALSVMAEARQRTNDEAKKKLIEVTQVYTAQLDSAVANQLASVRAQRKRLEEDLSRLKKMTRAVAYAESTGNIVAAVHECIPNSVRHIVVQLGIEYPTADEVKVPDDFVVPTK